MTSSTTQDNAEIPCDDSTSVWPMLLAAGSALFVGHMVGRVSFAKNVRGAVRWIEELPEPIATSVRML